MLVKVPFCGSLCLNPATYQVAASTLLVSRNPALDLKVGSTY